MKSRQMQQIGLDDWEDYADSYFFTVNEVQQILRRKSDKPVRTAIHNGTLKAINVGEQKRKQYRIQKRALMEYIEAQEVKPPPTSRKKTSRPADGRPFKHLKPTWLHEPSQQQAARSRRSGGRNARSRGGSSGQGGRR